MRLNTNETTSQRRGKERAELVRALEKITREVVEAEYFLSQKRDEQVALREQLLASVGGVKRRRLSDVPERVLVVAKLVHDAPKPLSRGDVAEALQISASNAGMRLMLALQRNLVDREGRGLYCAVGARTAPAGPAKP